MSFEPNGRISFRTVTLPLVRMGVSRNDMLKPQSFGIKNIHDNWSLEAGLHRCTFHWAIRIPNPVWAWYCAYIVCMKNVLSAFSRIYVSPLFDLLFWSYKNR